MIVLFISPIGCSNSSFRSVNASEIPGRDAGSAQPKQPIAGQVSAAQSNAPSQPKVSDSSVVMDVPSPKIEQEAKSRNSFLESMIAADLTSGTQPAPTEMQSTQPPPEMQAAQPPPPPPNMQTAPPPTSIASEQPRQSSFLDGLLAAGLAAGSLLSGAGQSSTPQPSTQVTSTPVKQCSSGSATAAPRAVDVVFNIDVSTSMNPYIQVVKENVIAFAAALERQGHNARVAAVGFVDEPLQSIDFAPSSAFQSILSGWRTIENGNFDTQEGGQSSLEHALWMLSAPEVGARPGAAKVIIHISDALAFAGENHDDFSVTQLSSTFRAARSQFGSLLFFDAVPTSAGETGPWATRKRVSLTPRMQMNDLRQQTQNLAGGPLPFPFAASSMTVDLPMGIQTSLAQLQGCN
jgi:hypothetical protein